jgi:GTPase SAR1 family protein
MVEMVADHLTPVALRYGYSDVPLEAHIKWRPQVMVIGNYSSGKSTLINELLGSDIQETGQAPTDDSFTIITHDENTSDTLRVRVTEERDGKVLLNDPEYPFTSLKKHGERFASHFKLKKVNAPVLRNLALIDTPGMLDSITERDRGYDYQEVIGDLAHIVDLILVLFDPHKAGTVREAHKSLRETLPQRTFEDRVMFVLNRIDECRSLSDLLRVYGTLCWNLSQITGRKDIPMIIMTFSPSASPRKSNGESCESGFLKCLENQRELLKNAVLDTPRRHLDHLATFVETHAERLSHFLEALISYKKGLRSFNLKFTLLGLLPCLLIGAATSFALMSTELIPGGSQLTIFGAGAAIAGGGLISWITLVRKFFLASYSRKQISNIDHLTMLDNQTRKDSWRAVKNFTVSFLKKNGGRYSLKNAKKEFADIQKIYQQGASEIREALNELATIRNDGASETFDSNLRSISGINT